MVSSNGLHAAMPMMVTMPSSAPSSRSTWAMVATSASSSVTSTEKGKAFGARRGEFGGDVFGAFRLFVDHGKFSTE